MYPQSMFMAKIRKNIKTFHLKINIIAVVKYCCILHGRVYVMMYPFSEESEASVLWKALAIRFEKYFSFARIYKPSSDDLKVFGLEQFFIDPPALFVLVADEKNLEKVNVVHFDKSKQGQFNYTNVMTFLFAINSEFRFKLPGENQSNQKTEAEMEDVVQIEAQRFEVQGQSDKKSSIDGSSKLSKDETVENIRFSATELKEEL